MSDQNDFEERKENTEKLEYYGNYTNKRQVRQFFASKDNVSFLLIPHSTRETGQNCAYNGQNFVQRHQCDLHYIGAEEI